MTVSLREKTAWISLTTTLLIWGSYFWMVYQRAATGRISSSHLFDLFAWCWIALFMAQGALFFATGVLKMGRGIAPEDERERLMALKATHLAYAVLTITVLCVAASTRYFTGFGAGKLADPVGDTMVLIANGILFAVVLAEIVKSGARIVYFRRGY
jgi:hypothetical protein